MCNITSRIKEYLDYKKIPISLFEKTTGMSNGAFGKQLKNKGAIGTDKLEKVLLNYPDLSPQWVLTGKGGMIKSAEKDKNDTLIPAVTNSQNHEEFKIIDTRPRIPYDAAAGSLSFSMDGIRADQCEQLPIIPTLPKYDFTIIARGDSMIPDFISGDELACAIVSESSFVQWGRVHVLDTAQGIVLKRIFDQRDSILCKSINHNYPDFDIPKDEVYHIAIVVGLIRHL